MDVEEIRAYTRYCGGGDFGDNSEQVIWLWNCVRAWSTDLRRTFLQFVTGSSHVPLDGFSPPLTVTEGVDMGPDSLPRAHTCFNQLVLPQYSSLEVMQQRLLFAIQETNTFSLT